MTRPQHLYLLAIITTTNGLTTLPSSVVQREPMQRCCSTTLQFQDDAFVDVEILSHQKIRLGQNLAVEIDENSIPSSKSKSAYREIRIPMEWYPEQYQLHKPMEDVNTSDPSPCSAYRRKECEGTDLTVVVKILAWKKKIGDVVKEGDIMVILEKSQLDSYGRTVDKQRIDVASKEDGILKTVLIPQGEELNLNKSQTRSMLALFHPTLFHSIDIDESTRMDTTLLVGETVETHQKKSRDNIRQEKMRVSSANTDMGQDVNGSGCEAASISTAHNVNTSRCETNATDTTHKKESKSDECECKDRSIGKEKVPAGTIRSLKIDQDIEERKHETTDCKEMLNSTLQIEHNESDKATAYTKHQEEKETLKESTTKNASNATLSLEQEVAKESAPKCKREETESKILENNETVAVMEPDDLVATERNIINTEKDKVVSLIQKRIDEEELDVEWIVDTAAKVVADVMFSEVPPNDEEENLGNSSNTSELLKNAAPSVREVSQDIETTLEALSGYEKISIYQEEDNGHSSTDLLASDQEVLLGSKQSGVFDAIVDFFTDSFQKTNDSSCGDSR